MRDVTNIVKFTLLLNTITGASLVLAQEPSSVEKVEDAAAVDDGWTDPVVYSPAERQAACRKYNGTYLAYYEKIFKVEKCAYREIQSAELILSLTRKKVKFTTVEGDVFAKLEKGEPIRAGASEATKLRTCRDLANSYITFGYDDVYYVEKCQKRLFPDWTSFTEHQRLHKKTRQPIIAVTYQEFSRIMTGRPMPSIIDANYAQQKIVSKNVDVIPIDEACRNLNGKDVTYVDRIYRIEKCHKRAYNVEQYLRKYGTRMSRKNKLPELSSEAWLSLPDGKDMPSIK